MSPPPVSVRMTVCVCQTDSGPRKSDRSVSTASLSLSDPVSNTAAAWPVCSLAFCLSDCQIRGGPRHHTQPTLSAPVVRGILQIKEHYLAPYLLLLLLSPSIHPLSPLRRVMEMSLPHMSEQVALHEEIQCSLCL